MVTIYIYTHTHTYIHTYLHTYIYVGLTATASVYFDKIDCAATVAACAWQLELI